MLKSGNMAQWKSRRQLDTLGPHATEPVLKFGLEPQTYPLLLETRAPSAKR
jgi:hypothetical protein